MNKNKEKTVPKTRYNPFARVKVDSYMEKVMKYLNDYKPNYIK